MIKAVIFDFDGVIADSEPLHLRAFQRTVKTLGLTLGTGDYYSRYLACDDRTFFRMFLSDSGRGFSQRDIDRLVEEKGVFFDEMAGEDVRIFPGVAEFLRFLRGRWHVAIGSGALSREINLILARRGLSGFFDFVVGADDTENAKPSPEVYLRCLENFQKLFAADLAAEQCLVFEDSPHGVLAAKRAGMKCVAIPNSCSARELSLADRTAENFFEIAGAFPWDF